MSSQQVSKDAFGERLIVSGSPFCGGKTEAIASYLCDSMRKQGENVDLVRLSRLEVSGCRGCNRCAKVAEGASSEYFCVISDDMSDVASRLLRCNELLVVAPVYFSGVPSQLKAVYDRLQPFFWRPDVRRQKRPLDLVILGGGGDPYGYRAYVSETCSALAMVGFKLRTQYDLVGKISEDEPLDFGLLDEVLKP